MIQNILYLNILLKDELKCDTLSVSERSCCSWLHSSEPPPHV